MTFSKILLASHNTQGAKAAEQLAIKMANDNSASITHLIIVPDFWQWMTGDDWLNNANTQKEYGNYVESELEGEILDHINRLEPIMQAEKITYNYKLEKGKPDKILIQESNEIQYDLIIIGSPRPKGMDGLNSKLLTKTLPAQVTTPLLIAAYPNHESD